MSKILVAFQNQQNMIRRIVAKYRSNPADIDEVTQDVFLMGFAAEQRSDIHEPERLLFRIAKNLAVNEAMRKVNTTSVSIEDSVILSVYKDEQAISAEDILDARQRLFIFSQALASLPAELRRVFVMRRVDGLQFKQIATRLNVSVSTVEKRAVAAMLQCRRYLTDNGHDLASFWATPQRRVQSDTSKLKNMNKDKPKK
ncbi:MAG: RNA polymerase sigma factor [Robiginitomaculum sp.]|nr:RNA polymerase sigma factor [Robiginitomaculum sp.]